MMIILIIFTNMAIRCNCWHISVVMSAINCYSRVINITTGEMHPERGTEMTHPNLHVISDDLGGVTYGNLTM